MSDNPLDPQADPFKPPEIPIEVHCLHCDQEYDSYLIEWRECISADGTPQGFWCCPTPGCDGIGFGFDILPTDPNYQDEHGGWVSFDDEEDGEPWEQPDEEPWDEKDEFEE
ncbi:MAG: hypothetical protein JXB10_06340 [Pirellulales bacterium]|nr:hypothetical protein [Pirellulales bacterium]